MLTKKEISNWLPDAEAAFRYYMPRITTRYPEVQIASSKTFRALRAQIVSETGCPIRSAPDDSCMEYIHGSLGGAILIRADLLPKNISHHGFLTLYWHELGHFYSINADSNDLERFNDPDNPPSVPSAKYKQRGYWFWQEFIAQAISNYVSYKVGSAQPSYAPEKIVWTVDNWSPLLERVQSMLDGMYGIDEVDEYGLAHYFAMILTEDMTLQLISASNAGKLIKYGESEPVPSGEIDVSCMDEVDEGLQPAMAELKAWLEEKLSHKHFWRMDEEGLEWLGRLIYGMDDILAEEE